MNLQNLHEGQVVKNYKELCRLLEIEEVSGNSKIIQMRELERLAKIEKDGHSFTVKELYKNVPEKGIESTFSNRSLYIGNFSVQLLHYLAEDFELKKSKGMANDGSNYMFTTPRDLFRLTGMVNEKYHFTKFAVRDFLNNNGGRSINNFDIDEFFNATTRKMYSITRSSLETLSKRLLIKYDSRHILTFRGDKIVTDDQQAMTIRTTQLKVYNEMIDEGKMKGMKRTDKDGMRVPVAILSEVHLSPHFEEFYARVNAELKSRYEWENIFSGWKINFHTEHLEENIEKYERDMGYIRENKLSLNNKLAGFIEKTSQKRYGEARNKYEIYLNQIMTQISQKKSSFAYEESFIKSQSLLVDMFIKIKE